MFDKYIEGVKKDGAEVKNVTAEGADVMVISDNIGLVDVVFRKGNTLAGANGATERRPGRSLRSLAGKEPAGPGADDRKWSVRHGGTGRAPVRGGDRFMNGLLASEFNDHTQTSHTKG